MTRQTAVVICPGRGTYNKPELGYLARHHADKAAVFARFDTERAALGQETLVALDSAETYSNARHTRGDNASALIYAATISDFMSINRDAYDVVAITGNSMGWYSALACGGALKPDAGFTVANTMGRLMQESMIGGQLIYPFVDEQWQPIPGKRAELLALVDTIATRADHILTLSIDLGGMLVLAGNENGLKAFESVVPVVQGRYPLRLANHAAFHSALQTPVAGKGCAHISADLFASPTIPLIDGRGAIWWPHATDTARLSDYTLGHQVTQTYDFTRAVQVATYEFAPDVIIIVGPGTTLGGAVAQSLILGNWRGLSGKDDFQARQASDQPPLLAMGVDTQRDRVVSIARLRR